MISASETIVGPLRQQLGRARPGCARSARRRSAASGGCRCRRRAARAAPPSTASASPGSPPRRRPASSGTASSAALRCRRTPANSLTMSGILGVAAERDERHPQVMPDQEQRPSRAPRRRAAAARATSSRHPHALERVVVVAPLADVVQQQRQHEQLGRGELAEDVAEALPVRLVGRRRAARGCGSSAACARRPCTCGRSRAPPATRSPGTRGTRGRAGRSRASRDSRA